MKKVIFLCLVCIGFSFVSFGQDWKTVKLQDTSYYIVNSADYNADPLKKALAICYLDSAKQMGLDSIFYFYPTARRKHEGLVTLDFEPCIDTLAACWLGKNFIRKNNGDETYQLEDGHSWLIKTKATLNETWDLQEIDTYGSSYRAFVTKIETGMVNGTLDSLKTIHMQRYVNSIPYNSFNLNFDIIISKNNGFIQVPNLWKQYYSTNEINPGAIFSLLEKPRYILDKSEMDLALIKYQAGNEWVIQNRSGYASEYADDSFFTFNSYWKDSIISATQLNNFQISVIKKNHYVSRYIDAIQQFISYDTSILSFPIIKPINLLSNIYPTVCFQAKQNKMPDFQSRYYFKQNLDSSIEIQKTLHKDLVFSHDTCLILSHKWYQDIETITKHQYFEAFNRTQLDNELLTSEIDETRLVYSKFGNVTFGNNPLPASNFNLHAWENNQHEIQLQWQTENETNSDYFIVQRKNETGHFIDISKIETQKNLDLIKTYNFLDPIQDQENTTLFYRIIMKDIDGQINYSNMVKVDLSRSNELLIYPNPFYDKLVIQGDFNSDSKTNITLLNQLGQQVHTEEIYGINPSINLNSTLATGVYFLKLTNSTGNEVYQKVIKK